jgi:signal transduction histidine kinase
VTLAEGVGRRLVAEQPEFRDDEVFRRLCGVLETGQPAVVEHRVDSGAGPVGTMRGVYIHRALPFGPDAVISLVSDITEQRRLEAELEQYAAAAAHDLREPILAVGFFAQLLGRRLDQGRDAENERLVGLLESTAERAKALIDGILEYARSGEAEDVDDVDSGELVAEVAGSLGAAIDRAGAEMRIGRLPVVRASRPQLGRVFQNIIANSLKFRSGAPPVLAVSAERDGALWRFAVADNGIGIPPERAADVFGMFARAHAGSHDGCGIGLAVCRRIVEGHGGAIWAEPVPEGGTVVRFTLPAGDGAGARRPVDQ